MPSSVIRGWSYDEAEHRLDVLFVSGKRYHYHEVPPDVAQGMRDAFSKGSYFNRVIRDHFAFTQDRRGRSVA
jgi:hypothetical protein